MEWRPVGKKIKIYDISLYIARAVFLQVNTDLEPSLKEVGGGESEILTSKKFPGHMDAVGPQTKL